MAEIRPFQAVRYDAAKAGPIDGLVAPPYDVISQQARAELAARSPYNVVRLTLPDDADEAARLWREWRAEGILRREEEPSYWVVQQDYAGPDGVARTRTGLVASLRAEPYEKRTVLPHERTHAGPKEDRLRLLRATGVQLEPLFLLYDGPQPFTLPAGPPEVDVEGTRLWRLPPDGLAGALAQRQLLIADGHHRYETAVTFAQEAGERYAWVEAVLVSTEDPGLTIFPTHRVLASAPREPWAGAPAAGPEEALRALEELPPDEPAVVQYMGGETRLVAPGRPGVLDVQLVDELGHDGILYTPDWREAVARVDSGEAEVAYLLRPTRIEDVFRAARRGEVLPQKTTYFFPKLPSGLLFHPLG